MTLELRSRSPEETEAIGASVGRLAEPGTVVALHGPLAAGKTVFTKGVARGIEVPRPQYVSSPTFTLHKSYEGRLTLHHLDLYRLSEQGDLEDLGLDEALFGTGISVIEWPDLFLPEVPPDRLTVRFLLTAPEERTLLFEACGPRSAALLSRLAEALPVKIAREDADDL
ncbi:MAG: tRNA (adenosine(37)-N6)-threonylcarbamoyltransferase complex ATPase subunit type 1 TsaE [Deltaproteobacteria bacterium]|nr:tRNA (adenosine(37)-N6)-threonylcarbamoyltransferase complex ATPase subunit type 1 TsaE [Deltaproteobacteria bacterium]